MKLIKFIKVFIVTIFCFSNLTFSQNKNVESPKEDILDFISVFSVYSLEKYDIKYSPAEYVIKKAIEALPKVAANETVSLENKKYSMIRVYELISVSIKEKFKNIDQLGKMVGDIRLVDKEIGKEIGKKGDETAFYAKVKHFEERKNTATNFYEVIPDEVSIMRAISAGRLITNSAEKAKLKKNLDFIIKEKLQILKELESAFKKLPIPVATASIASPEKK